MPAADSPSRDDFPRLRRSPAAVAFECRCGTKVARGSESVGVAHLPRSLEGVFGDAAFCSTDCVRAFMLETLESLDALDTPAARAIVSGLREMYQTLAATLVSVMDD